MAGVRSVVAHISDPVDSKTKDLEFLKNQQSTLDAERRSSLRKFGSTISLSRIFVEKLELRVWQAGMPEMLMRAMANLRYVN